MNSFFTKVKRTSALMLSCAVACSAVSSAAADDNGSFGTGTRYHAGDSVSVTVQFGGIQQGGTPLRLAAFDYCLQFDESVLEFDSGRQIEDNMSMSAYNDSGMVAFGAIASVGADGYQTEEKRGVMELFFEVEKDTDDFGFVGECTSLSALSQDAEDTYYLIGDGAPDIGDPYSDFSVTIECPHDNILGERKDSYSEGDEVTVTVSVGHISKNGSALPLCAVDYIIGYDPQVLDTVSTEPAVASGMFEENKDEPGVIKIAAMAEDGFTGDYSGEPRAIYTARFTVKQDSAYLGLKGMCPALCALSSDGETIIPFVNGKNRANIYVEMSVEVTSEVPDSENESDVDPDAPEETDTDTSTDKTTDTSTDKTTDTSTDNTTDTSTDKTTDTSTDKTPDTSTDKTPDTSTDKTSDTSTDKTPDTSTDKTTDTSTDKTPDTSTDKTPDTSTDKTTDTSTDKTTDTSTDKTTDTSTDKTPDTSTDKTTDTSTDKTTDTSTDKTTDTSTDKKPDTSTDKTPDTSTDKTPDTSTDKTPDTSTDKTPDTSTDKTPDTSTDKTTDTSTDTTTDTSTDTAADTESDTSSDSEPATPDTPSDGKDTPDTPDEPSKPATSDVPESPDTPEDPDKPHDPDTPVPVTPEITEGDVGYKVLSDDTAMITDFKGDDKEVVIPSRINGKKVTRIDANAFRNNPNIETVIISDDITEIGDNAFENCENLGEVVIGENVTNISSTAFLNCANVLMFGARGSYAEQFAAENNIAFVNMYNLIGDIDEDGVIDSGDSLAILRYSASAQEFSRAEQVYADTNIDKTADSFDALQVLRYSVTLPAAERIGTPVIIK